MVRKGRNRFEGVPVEEDTRLLSRTEMEIEGVPVRHENWSWDGVYGETLVFVSADVESKDTESLKAFARASGRVSRGSEITIKRSDSGYTFVNFNFD